MDLDRIAAALGCASSDIAHIVGDTVTLADGTAHTFADPARFELADYTAKPTKAAKSAATDPTV
jgi:hypothetical protein